MLELRDITKTHRTAEMETTALRDIDLRVDEGEFLAIMGPSGCGKSTLLNVLGMLDRPSSGDYFFLGENIARYSEARLTSVRRRHVGFIFQSFNLIDELSVRENVELSLLYRGVRSAERRKRADAVLERMGIAHRAGHRPAQLSGGQQQRVAVARALVADPNLILADEPTGNLDSRHGQEVMDLLKQLNEDGATVIMVTHSLEHANFARRVVQLLDGSIVTESRGVAA